MSEEGTMAEKTEGRESEVAAMARALAEKATGTPAYLLDDETFDGYMQQAREVVALTPPPPEPTPLQEAIRKARGDEPTAEEIEQSIDFLNRASAALTQPEKGAPDAR